MLRPRPMLVIPGILLFAAPLTTPLTAQPTDPEARQEFEHLAYLLGDWHIEAKIRNSPTTYLEGSGTMSVRLDTDGETFLADMNVAFAGFDVVGTTVRRYDPERGLWQIEWQSAEGAEPRIEGHFIDGRLVEINWGIDQRGPFIGRLTKRKITEDHFVVRKDRLYDDGTVFPETWVYEATRTSR